MKHTSYVFHFQELHMDICDQYHRENGPSEHKLASYMWSLKIDPVKINYIPS